MIRFGHLYQRSKSVLAPRIDPIPLLPLVTTSGGVIVDNVWRGHEVTCTVPGNQKTVDFRRVVGQSHGPCNVGFIRGLS